MKRGRGVAQHHHIVYGCEYILLVLTGLLWVMCVQVHPAEVREGVQQQLDISFSYDAQVASFCLLESQMGRRAPALAGLQWGDVKFVKQAVLLKDGLLVHAFGCALKLRNEKVVDEHNSCVIVFDSSGDNTLLDEILLSVPRAMVNLAVGMGVIDAKALEATPVAEVLPMIPGSSEW